MKKNISKDRIVAYLNNSLSSEEKKEFYSWLDEDIQNKHLYFETKLIFDASKSINNPIDINQSWERLLAKKTSKQFSFSKFAKKALSYAAIALIAVLLTNYYFSRSIQSSSNEVVTAYLASEGQKADVILLSDGTTVSIGRNTKLKIGDDYGKRNRIVYLEGEAFFDVAKQKNKPFIVKVQNQNIEALGTKFNVLAYSTDNFSILTLLEGSVRSTIEGSSVENTLLPNQQLVYNRDSQELLVSEVDAVQYISWMDGYFYFEEQNLSSIFNRLGQIYGLEFDILSPSLNNKKFTGTFYAGQSIENVLEVLSYSVPIKFHVEEGRIIILE